jgi:hypothetical protein
MNRLNRIWMRSALLALLAAPVLMSGCTEDVGDVDRTQSARLSKESFGGVWYYVRTVADVPFTTAATFQAETYTGANEGAQKIIFDVQEDLLVAYPVWEKVEGLEADQRRRQIRRYWDPKRRGEFIDIYVGQPIAAWNITSHFDVKRQYAASTGEPSNIIEENDTDRPWWERDYIRVDWNSENLGDIAFVTGDANAEAQSLLYVEEGEQSPLNPDAPDFEEDYIGIVTKYRINPNPAGCAVWGLGRNDCVPANIKVRHSFRKANPAEDAITRHFSNREHMDKFGYFLADRYDWDPEFGLTEAARDYKAQLWNLWQVSQEWDDPTGPDGERLSLSCNTQSDCPAGTRCIASEWFEDGKCKVGTPLPYRQRGTRPIIYHLSESHPGLMPLSPVVDDEGNPEMDANGNPMYEGGSVVLNEGSKYPHPYIIEAYETADGWSNAFKETVAWLYYHEDEATLHVSQKRQGARACTTHAECITTHQRVLSWQYADTMVDAKFACSSDADCTITGDKCINVGNGCNEDTEVCDVCAKQVTCSDASPCPLGAACQGQVCVDADDKPVLEVRKGLPVDKRAYTFVVWADEEEAIQVTRLTDRLLPAGVTATALQSAGDAVVRFVNATPGTTVTLRAVLADPQDSSQDDAVQTVDVIQNAKAQADDPANQEKMLGYRDSAANDARFPWSTQNAQKVRRYEVVEGGKVVAKLHNVFLAAGSAYTLVYGNGQLLVTSDQLVPGGNPPPPEGIRVINAVPASVKANLDFGVDSLLLGRMVEPSTIIAHKKVITTGTNRFVVLEGGAPGDVTCYDDNGFGKCVGWGAALGEDAQDTIRTMMTEEIEEMFVLCQPIYHGDSCTEEQLTAPLAEKRKIYNDCRYSKKLEDGTIYNPCKKYVADPMGLKKLGDIRYNFFYWVAKAQAASPLGYGPSAADPEYGNTFYGIANIYGAPLITQGRYSQDLLDLINGNLDFEDVLTGDYVRDYILSKKDENPDLDAVESTFESLMLSTSLSGDGHVHNPLGELGPAQLPDALRQLTDLVPASKMRHRGDFIEAMNNPALRVKLLPSFHEMHTDTRSSRLAMVRDSWVAGLLVNDEVKLAASNGAIQPGMDAGDAIEDVLDLAIDPARLARLESKRNYILDKANICMSSFEDDALVGLTMELGCTTEKLEQGYTEVSTYIEATRILEGKKESKGKALLDPADKVCFTGEALAVTLTARVYGGVLEHEVGHTVGLRHNFAASGDIFNFDDEWYSIRERERIHCYDQFGCDYNRGDVCAYRCEVDADCPSVAACEERDGSKVCVDKQDDRADIVGWCMTPAPSSVSQNDCTFNPASAAPGSAVRVWDEGQCWLQTFCKTNAQCGQGQTCEGDFCADQVTGLLFREPATESGCTANSDCTNGDRCDNGEYAENAAPNQCLTFRLGFVARPNSTQKEAEMRQYEYQLSTVMDYGQKINADIHGLGKYDFAAIKFGYGDLVEVYADTSYIDEYVAKAATLGFESAGTTSFYRSSSSWMESLNHPFRFMNFVLGIENAGSWNRVSVPWQQVKLERQMQFDYLNRGLNSTYIEVPYQFCSDEFRGNGGCYYFDAGVDDVEVVRHSMDMLREYYIFDAFKRDRYSFGWGTAGTGYFARIIDRWMQPMRNSGLYAALYTHLFADLGFWELFSKEPMSGIHFGMSSRMAFQNLVELVASPAPGTYVYDEDSDSYRNVSYETGAAQGDDVLNIEVGPGKFPYTTFDSRFGYHMYNHPLFAGSYWEKLAAITVLTENDVTFLSDYVGQDLDVGIKSAIGFSSLYPTPIVNLFGAIVADAQESWAGVADVNADGKLVYRPRNALLPSRDTNLPSVEPSLNNLSFKALAGLYALAQVPAAFDTSITDSLTVVYAGNAAEYTLSDGLEWDGFEDPFGKKTYYALRPRYDNARIPAAALLIDRANELRDEWLDAETEQEAVEKAQELNQVIDVLDMLRELTSIYGVIEI